MTLQKTTLFGWAPALLGSCLLATSCSSNSTFRSMDANRDGQISKTEFRTSVQSTAFNQLDTDSNGKIGETEWLAHEDVRDPGDRFQSLDKNGDGHLTFPEFANHSRKHLTLENFFGTLDTDGDGLFSRDEL